MNDERKRLSRRRLLGAGAAAGFATAFGGSTRTAEAGQGRGQVAPQAVAGGELVLTNGRIHTMDRNNTVASTLTIRNGRLAPVGGAPPRPATGRRIIDLKGRTVVPGIIDNHNHIVLMGNRPGYHTPLENAASIRDVQEILSTRAKDIPRGGWITTIGGFHRNQLFPPGQTPRLPMLQELDAAAPNNPVYISESFNGPSTTNTLGQRLFDG